MVSLRLDSKGNYIARKRLPDDCAKSTDASTAPGSRRSSPPVPASESRLLNRSFTNGQLKSSSASKPFAKRSAAGGSTSTVSKRRPWQVSGIYGSSRSTREGGR
jgi:hypothetical protein